MVECRGHKGVMKSFSINDNGTTQDGKRDITFNIEIDNGFYTVNVCNAKIEEINFFEEIVKFVPVPKNNNPFTLEYGARCQHWENMEV